MERSGKKKQLWNGFFCCFWSHGFRNSKEYKNLPLTSLPFPLLVKLEWPWSNFSSGTRVVSWHTGACRASFRKEPWDRADLIQRSRSRVLRWDYCSHWHFICVSTFSFLMSTCLYHRDAARETTPWLKINKTNQPKSNHWSVPCATDNVSHGDWQSD